MTKLSYTRALNQALAAEMERDPAVFVLGEDVRHALTNVTVGLFDRFGPERIVETPLSEQGVPSGASIATQALPEHVLAWQTVVEGGQSLGARQETHFPLPSQTLPPSSHAEPAAALAVPQQPDSHVARTQCVGRLRHARSGALPVGGASCRPARPNTVHLSIC